MKVKVNVSRDIIVDVPSEALEKIAFYEATKWPDSEKPADSVYEQAIQDVEQVMGIRFADSTAPETICAVYTGNNNTLLEWW